MAKFDERPESPQGGPIAPGESRTFSYTVDGQPKTLKIERTGRPYAYDLCDTYNRTMSAAAKQNGAEWYVDNQGQVRLGQSAEWSARHAKQTAQTQEDERRQWMRHNWRANQG